MGLITVLGEERSKQATIGKADGERERGKLLERTEKGENRIAGSFALLGSVRYCYVCLWSLSSSGPAGQNVRNGRQRSERASSSNLTLEAQPNVTGFCGGLVGQPRRKVKGSAVYHDS